MSAATRAGAPRRPSAGAPRRPCGTIDLDDRPTAARPAARRPHAHDDVARQQRADRHYAAAALERGIAEIAITDHVDFEPGAPAFAYATFADRERIVRDAAERWGPQGVHIRFGVELTYDRSWEPDIRDHLARHAYDFTIGSVHDRVDSPYHPRRVAAWVEGRSLSEIVAPSFDEVEAAARSGLFDAIGHIDGVKRYLYPHVTPAALAGAPELYEPILHALVESGTALEVNTSGLRYADRRAVPAAGDRGPLPRARWPSRSRSARTPTVPSTSAGAWRTATPSRPRPVSRS